MKKNKVLKALGVGALALTGMCTMAGCMASGAEITNEEKAQIMSTVNDGSEFMNNMYSAAQEENSQLKAQNDLLKQQLEETKSNNEKQNEILHEKNEIFENENDLLKQQLEETKANNENQNEILQEKNEILENQNDLLEKEILILQTENSEQIKAKAKELVMLARMQLRMNFNGVRDNLTITASCGNEASIFKYYTFESGRVAELVHMGTIDGVSMGYITYDDEKVAYTAQYFEDEQSGEKQFSNEIVAGGTLDNYILENNYVYALINNYLVDDPNYGFSKFLDNILSVEIKANGNYLITCVVDETNSMGTHYLGMYQAEITPNGRFVLERSKTAGTESGEIVYEYEYGAVDEQEILSYIEMAKEVEPQALLDISSLQFRTIEYGASGDIGDFIYNFSALKFYYFEDGEIKEKSWNTYDEFIADGGKCEGFSTSNYIDGGWSICTFTYNGVSARVSYNTIKSE